jgi:hypothetical protein
MSLARDSVADDIRSQGAQRMPREFHPGVWIAAVIAVAATAVLIWLL